MNDSSVPSADTVSEKARLCSQCGLCMVKKWKPKESIKSCVFTTGWLGKSEVDIFGRKRAQDDPDEVLFGIAKKRFISRMKNPLPQGQFTGIITSIAKIAFESRMVDAVVTVHRSNEDYLFPVPVLARTTEEILKSGGSKPVLAKSLVSLEKAVEHGIKRLLVVGTPCQIHNVHKFQQMFPYLDGIDIYKVGIPCVDNSDPKKFRWVLSKISRSPDTVRFIEFMQDFTVHLRHEDGHLERVPFFSLPKVLSGNDIFPPSCMSCFDYLNSLADITVGYLAAPLDISKMPQWVIIRTEKGESLFELIARDTEMFPEDSKGDRTTGVRQYAQQILDRFNGQETVENEDEVAMSMEEGFEFADFLYQNGPKGLEFARYAVESHLIRSYYFLKYRYPELLPILVPGHVYPILESYDLKA